MLIGKNWKVESDEYNVTLYRRKLNKKTGKEYWEESRYYSTLANCLTDLVNLEVNGSGLKDLQTVGVAVAKIHQEIAEALTPIRQTAVEVGKGANG